jgi:hypothetical protein
MTLDQARWLTVAFLTAWTAVAISYDVVVVTRYGPEASISRVLGWMLARLPVVGVAVVFWLGLLVGHLWLPSK